MIADWPYEGMERAAAAQEAETPGYGEALYNCICQIAAKQATVHIDDVLAVFDQKPAHPNANGAPWKRARNEGILVHSGQFRPTAGGGKNAHVYPVYRSMIYTGAQ